MSQGEIEEVVLKFKDRGQRIVDLVHPTLW